MIAFSLILLVLGVFLSAFFSGNETGFYRASRVRIVMAALDGDRVSKAMLKQINNPTWFVATTLIGNNVANYLTSLSIVLLTAQLMASSAAAEMLMPIAFSPLLFVYGELLPKSLFYQSPNLLLRFCAPLFLFFTWLFAPVTLLLWAMGKLLERLVGQSPERIRLALARKELQQVLEDGFEAGILQPTQQQLAQSFFLVASQPVGEFCTPVARVKSLRESSTRAALLKMARKNELADIPVYRENRGQLVGYVRTVDLLIKHETTVKEQVRQLMEVKSVDLFGEAVLQMQSVRETLAKVVDQHGQTVGILSIDQLTDPLLAGPLGSLRR